MMKQIGTILILLLLLSSSCKDRAFSKVQKLSEFKNTDFAPTLEEEIKDGRNSIYCATLLFAWDEVRNQINQPIEIDKKYSDLIKLNQSKTYQNTLNEDEFKVDVEIDKDTIKVIAEFDKNLPFEFDLKSYNNKLKFDGQKVASFGITGLDSYDLLKNVSIIYYKNDSNFLIKLHPKDKTHEIILFKSDQKFTSFIQMNTEIERLTKIGIGEIKNYKLQWKYRFEHEDELVIPKFNFNIESNYPRLEQNRFKSKDLKYKLTEVFQRTAFILDESGAKIESIATVETTTEESIGEENIKKPKKMFFDKPFLLILKRVDSKNPYFAVWNTNAELMEKE